MSNDLNITVDQVNHPVHYTTDPSGIECIQITRHRNFTNNVSRKSRKLSN